VQVNDSEGGATAGEVQPNSAEKKAKKAAEQMLVAATAMRAAGLSPGTIKNAFASQFQVSRLHNGVGLEPLPNVNYTAIPFILYFRQWCTLSLT
jgi:hypothetical protein